MNVMEEIKDKVNAFITIKKLTPNNLSEYEIKNTFNSILVYENRRILLMVCLYNNIIDFYVYNSSYTTMDEETFCSIAIKEIKQMLDEEKTKHYIYSNHIVIQIKNLEEFTDIFNKCSKYMEATIYDYF